MARILKNGVEYGVGGQTLIDKIYPVGSIYVSTSASFNPQETWGGTWKRTADGRCLIGANNTYPLGSTGGEAEHTLTISETPAHKHIQKGIDSNMVTSADTGGGQTGGRSIDKYTEYTKGYVTYTGSTGGGAAHNNMQPYLAVYIWERIA